jgi:hypothetical protein
VPLFTRDNTHGLDEDAGVVLDSSEYQVQGMKPRPTSEYSLVGSLEARRERKMVKS